MSKYGGFSSPDFPPCELNTGNTGQKKLQIWTLFTQWFSPNILFLSQHIYKNNAELVVGHIIYYR